MASPNISQVANARQAGKPIFPTEVMLQIWAYMVKPAFIIPKTKCSSGCEAQNKGEWAPLHSSEDTVSYHRSDCAVPVVLHLCRASRFEYLYNHAVSKNHPTYRICHFGRGKNIYLDIMSDFVMLDSTEPLKYPSLRGIRHLGHRTHVNAHIHTWAIENTDPDFYFPRVTISAPHWKACGPNSEALKLSKKFTHLETLTLVYPSLEEALLPAQSNLKSSMSPTILAELEEEYHAEVDDWRLVFKKNESDELDRHNPDTRRPYVGRYWQELIQNGV